MYYLLTGYKNIAAMVLKPFTHAAIYNVNCQSVYQRGVRNKCKMYWFERNTDVQKTTITKHKQQYFRLQMSNTNKGKLYMWKLMRDRDKELKKTKIWYRKSFYNRNVGKLHVISLAFKSYDQKVHPCKVDRFGGIIKWQTTIEYLRYTHVYLLSKTKQYHYNMEGYS